MEQEQSESTAAETTEDESESLLTPPISTKNPVSILTSLRDSKPVKKNFKVKFADEASSSDSESLTLEVEFPYETDSVSSSSSQAGTHKQFQKKSFELRRKLLDKDGTDLDLKDVLKGEVNEADDTDEQEGTAQEEATPGGSTDAEKGEEVTEGGEDGSKPQLGTSGDEVTNIATALLNIWANLKVKQGCLYILLTTE